MVFSVSSLLVSTAGACRREWAWALKRDFPHLQFSLNGAVQSCHEATAVLQHRYSTPAISHSAMQQATEPAVNAMLLSNTTAATMAASEGGVRSATSNALSAVEGIPIANGNAATDSTPALHCTSAAEASHVQDGSSATHDKRAEGRHAQQSNVRLPESSDDRNNSAAAQPETTESYHASHNNSTLQETVDSRGNGGATSSGQETSWLEGRDLQGVMIGRQAFYQTWNCLADADRAVFGAASNAALTRRQVSSNSKQYVSKSYKTSFWMQAVPSSYSCYRVLCLHSSELLWQNSSLCSMKSAL